MAIPVALPFSAIAGLVGFLTLLFVVFRRPGVDAIAWIMICGGGYIVVRFATWGVPLFTNYGTIGLYGLGTVGLLLGTWIAVITRPPK